MNFQGNFRPKCWERNIVVFLGVSLYSYDLIGLDDDNKSFVLNPENLTLYIGLQGVTPYTKKNLTQTNKVILLKPVPMTCDHLSDKWIENFMKNDPSCQVSAKEIEKLKLKEKQAYLDEYIINCESQDYSVILKNTDAPQKKMRTYQWVWTDKLRCYH